MNVNDTVQGTHVDAAVGKHAAAARGYFKDPWINSFVRIPKKTTPLFNRGYWSRVRAVQVEVLQFVHRAQTLDPGRGVQIVNVGAGLDTMYWWLKQEQAAGRIPESLKIIYYELDFAEVVHKKTRAVQAHKMVPDFKIAANRTNFVDELSIADCHFIACDLRIHRQAIDAITSAGYDASHHTCFLSECVLAYLPSTQGNPIIQWAIESIKDPSALCGFIMYEQTNIDTAFGKVMVKNLNARGCPLLSTREFPTMIEQKKRFHGLGWKHVRARDMNEVYNSLPAEERKRIEKIELLDELEELYLIQAHYFVLVASSHE